MGILENAGFRIETRTTVFARLSDDELRAEIFEVNAIADEVGCVFYPGEDMSRMLVLFSGHHERFLMLKAVRTLSCSVLCFQDPKSYWFRGGLLPDIGQLSEFLAAWEHPTQMLLFGQSSGGYAALAASRRVKNGMTIAVGPQTYADTDDKAKINFGKPLQPMVSPHGVLDLKDFLADATESTKRAILFSASEVENPYERFLWLDHLHAFRMLGVPGVELFMVRATRHPLVMGRAEMFGALLAEALANPAAFRETLTRHVNIMSA